MQKTKLLFVIDTLLAGGAERSLVNLLSLLDYERYEVDLQLLSDNNLFSSLLPAAIHLLPVPKYFQSMRRSLRELMMAGEINYLRRRLLASIKLRVTRKNLHIHPTQVMWGVVKNCLEMNPTHYDAAIAYGQGMPTYYVDEKVTAKKKFAWMNCLYSLSRYNRRIDHGHYQQFNGIILVSDHSHDDFARVYPDLTDKLHIIYDVIDPRIIIKSANEGESFSDNFGGIRIVTLGRLAHQKGMDIAIQSCRLLLDKGYDIRWYVIGSRGHLQGQMEQMITELHLEKTFILLGEKTNPYRLMAEGDLYVQPSRVESYCMALAEAKILCRPIVATNFALVKEHLQDGVNGLIAEIDAQDLAAKISLLIDNEPLRIQFISRLKQERPDSSTEVAKVYQLVNKDRD